MTVKIIENLLPNGYINDIQKDVTRTGFQWFYIRDVTNQNYGSNSGFVHPAFDYGKQPTEWYPYIKPLVYSIEEAHGEPITQLLRIRVGLLLPTNEPNYEYNTPHVDFLWEHKTACFYVNDSDGDTVIFKQRLEEVEEISEYNINKQINEESIKKYTEKTKFEIIKTISPVKNRLVIFDGLNFHASTKPKINETRIVITVNFI